MPSTQHTVPSCNDGFKTPFQLNRMIERNNCVAVVAEMYYEYLQAPGYNALTFKDEITRIKCILQQLPLKQRHICELYFAEDFSYKEIARFTNLSPTTVKNHIAWSMIILRNYMTRPKAPV